MNTHVGTVFNINTDSSDMLTLQRMEWILVTIWN